MGDGRKSWLRGLVEFALDHDVDLQIEQQRKILLAEPSSARAHFDLATLYYSQRRVAEAIAEYEAAIECDSSFRRAYRRLGEIYINRGDYERASQYGLKAAELGDRTLLEMFERYPAVETAHNKNNRERASGELRDRVGEKTCTDR
jgi:tetratricopeptide (TPR) repeat protein